MMPIEKEKQLRQLIRSFRSVAIAYSGGVDSTYLLKVATEEIGQRAVGVIATSPAYPEREFKKARRIAEQMGARLITIRSRETEIPEFVENPPNRCYFCKEELFQSIARIAAREGLRCMADGSTMDDMGDHRPGMVALRELNVRSPLQECGFTKDDIRERSRELGLTTWNQPSFACLASRFPYGTPITEVALKRIDQSEALLYELGFRVVRVRHHGEIARIEVGADEMERLFDSEVRRRIVDAIKSVGYKYVALDLEGYRTGSMNEVLDLSERNIL